MSSRHSTVAAFLCGTLLAQGLTSGPARAAEAASEAALLLKYVAPGIPDATARRILDPLPALLKEELSIRWVPAPEEPAAGPEEPARLPLADDAVLRGIAGKLSGATASMEKVEWADARRLLDQAERDARSYRFDEAIRPFLFEIFLRKGMLALWEGDTTASESFLARSRALRPGFSPDPALFPPQFLSAWARAADRPAPEAELLVQSLPPGAQILVDGEKRGMTPLRVRIASPGAHRIRLTHPGYRDATREGQWLPGDSEILEFTLTGDRIARLGEIIGGPLHGSGSGPILTEVAAAAGVGRVAIIVLEKGETGDALRARLYARPPAGGDAVPIGEEMLSPGNHPAGAAAKWAAGRMQSAGWPPAGTEGRESPWYSSIWLWAAVVSAAVAIAIAAGGGGAGSGSGSSTGTVAVNF
ncbi:MAG TPA: PEGA domain-containing protein [Candidatus Deferrimicrobiaceae bacterium]